MSRFVKIDNASGNPIAVNLDKILYIMQSENGIHLVYSIAENGVAKGVNLSMSLDDFLHLASDKV